MSKLIAVEGDLVFGESGGELIAQTQDKVYVQGKLVVVDGDIAQPVDDDDDPEANPTGFSSKVFIQGNGVHREGDLRENNYMTIIAPGGNDDIFAG